MIVTGKFAPVSPREVEVGPAGKRKKLNARPDIPDIRDRMYEPPLIELKTFVYPAGNVQSPILDQGDEGSCTGFALAGTINLLLNQRVTSGSVQARTGDQLVSPRMLYEMAKVHDDWPGEAYEGSSARGAVKGFFHNGVCTLAQAPYVPKAKDWRLTVARAKDARNVGLGAYYRLRPQMIDYHAAINQVGAIYVSADVHEGWLNPTGGKIVYNSKKIGGHAFIIVGYDADGFLIQNSWGTEWGGFNSWQGIAHWTYEDWARNVSDAWALRLAVPTPAAFDLTHIAVDVDSASGARGASLPEPRREEILGHFAHINNGKFVETGRYGVSLANVEETAKYLTDDANGANKYQHLMFFCHGGLNDDVASARRIAATKEAYKRNGIYPFHFMWETGFAQELKDILAIKFAAANERIGGIRDLADWAIEKATRGIGLPIWREMKLDADRAFAKEGAGTACLRTLLTANAALQKPRAVHFVGHSAGAILIAKALGSLKNVSGGRQKLASVSLMAPACTVGLYREAYEPALGGAGARIRLFRAYNMVDAREQDDNVLSIYGKSLLYLVSDAYEDQQPTPILGMEIASAKLKPIGDWEIYYAGRDRSRTDSMSHGGFDSDKTTLNDILENILGKKPRKDLAFQDSDLFGF